ncbi:uncharacterized protein LOC124183311 [Neodiprion fabricii]|uniref:uncharacterized protein LOC124183311 n=1 Tax=Neodiprion fabricii TaxID=2872261 RepID=UPI001ED8E7BC|nr:uncharacterized protein LOC124183311 [Neodiprion fabricii]
MAFKFVALFALVAAANAGVLAPAPLAYHAAPAYAHAVPAYGYASAPLAKAVVAKTVDADYDAHPQYSYAYDVQDSITGDNKQQHETRDGDVVQGSYSLIESDGTRRTVDYTADPVNGFNAVVHKEPAGVAVKTVAAPVVAKYAAPVAHAPLAYAAPVAHAPLSYAAPAAHVTYAAPAVAHAAPLSYSAYAAPTAHVSYAAPAYAYHGRGLALKNSGSIRRYKRPTTTLSCISNPADDTAAMAFKFVALFALVAAANAGVLAPAPLAYHAAPAYAHAVPAYGYASAPLAKAVVAKTVDADYDAHPQYSYAYDVQDSITGDNKQQHETRDGDVVQGSYSLIESDGTRRTVDYTADPVNGFNAVVHKEPAGVAVKTVAAPVVAKYAAPVAHAPLAYAAPVAHAPLSYAAPAAHVTYAAPAFAYHHYFTVTIRVQEHNVEGMEQNCCDNSLAKEKEDVNSVLGERLSGARPRDEKLSGSFRRYKRLTTTQNCISNPQDITAAMAFKFITLLALVAAANAGGLAPAPLAYHAAPAYGYAAPAYGYAAPIAKAVVTKTVDAEYDPHPQYSYAYDVQDSITGDNKEQHETRDGDVVHGGYSLIEADGTRRIVDYTADPVNGFNAVVRKEGAAVAVKAVAAPVVAKVAAPLAYAAPVAKYAAPLTYSTYGAPIAKYAAPLAYSAYAAPVAKYAAPLSYAAPAVAHAAPLSYTAYAAPTAHVSYAAPAYAYHH